MTDADKTVFISYRREPSKYLAAYVYKDLVAHGYDVFWDISGIDSGDYAQAILNQIAARMHFVVILAPESVKRFAEPDDWLRREIEMAMDLGRNVVPVVTDGFNLGSPDTKQYLTGKLEHLPRYQSVSAPLEYLDEAMARLRTRYLIPPQYRVVISPPPPQDRPIVEQKQAEARQEAKPTEKELTAEEYFSRAMRLNDNSAEELALYNKAIQLNPQYRQAFYNRAILRMEQGDVDGAIADYTETIRLNPRYAEAYNNRGMARKAQGDLNGAIADYNEAIRLNPRYAEAYNNRGVARKARGDLDGAIADYNEVIHLNPRYAEAYNNRGVARKAHGDLDGAIADYSEAVRLNPQYDYAYFNRADARKTKGDIRGAIADYQKYLDLGGGKRDGDQDTVERVIADLKKRLK